MVLCGVVVIVDVVIVDVSVYHCFPSHIVESCPLTKLNGGISRLHSADEDAVSWLTSYGP